MIQLLHQFLIPYGYSNYYVPDYNMKLGEVSIHNAKEQYKKTQTLLQNIIVTIQIAVILAKQKIGLILPW